MQIFFLQETWNRVDMPTGCPLEYREIIFPSTKLKSLSQGRDSGGLLIWYKMNLTHSIELIKKGDFSIWIKIKKEVVSTERDIFMCTAYIPPSESPYYNENSFSVLEDEISFYQTQGNVLICGDLCPEQAQNQIWSMHRETNTYLARSASSPSHQNRNNFDKTVNRNGQQLLQLCCTLGLYIANGRLRGDSFGLYTHSSPLGNSTVDYSITDLEPFSVRAFTVSPSHPYLITAKSPYTLVRLVLDHNTEPHLHPPHPHPETRTPEQQHNLLVL